MTMTKEQLSALTVVELKAMAKENGLKGYSKLRKAELIEVLAVEVVEVEEVSEVQEVQETKEVQEVQEVKTAQILDAFFTSCLKFWQNEKDRGYTSNISVTALALNDVRVIKNNPFSPKGKALNVAVKENWLAQEVLNSYLKGDLTPAIDFTLVENKMLSSYEVMHNIEELENVSIIFPATEEYKAVKEKYHNFRSEKAWHELMEMQENGLEILYDYNNPSEICYNGTFYTVHGGMVLEGDDPKK